MHAHLARPFLLSFLLACSISVGINSYSFSQAQKFKTVQITKNSQTQAVTTEDFFYPPYQNGVGHPVQIEYHGVGAEAVILEASNQRTSKTYKTTLEQSKQALWIGSIPTDFFNGGDKLQIIFTPTGVNGIKLCSPEQVINYTTLNQPEAYKASIVDTDLSKLLIAPFQMTSSSSPSFNVYWPELYYSAKPVSPLAARVTSSRAPENSIRKLDPITNKPGWFQFQVPTGWFTPGEEITVDFSSIQQQHFSKTSDYPLPTNTDFKPLQTVQFKTRPN